MKKYIKDNKIRTRNQIVLHRTRIIKGKDGKEREVQTQIINPTEEMILADGWVEYIPEPIVPKPYQKSPLEVVEELVIKQWNDRTDISNEEALDYMVIVYPWENYIGETLQAGKIVAYKEKLYRVRQSHEVLDIYPPSIDTASLYEAIDKEHSGEADDPIPYAPPMEIFAEKYYVEDSIIYRCTRSSGVALSHSLKDLIGIYVEQA